MPNVILTSVTRFAGPSILGASCRLFQKQAHAPSKGRLVSKGHTVVACDAAFADAALMSDYAARFGPLALLCASDQPRAIAQFASSALAAGRIDAVVCNDYFPAIRAPVSEAKLEDLKAGFDALVVAPFALVKELVPHLKTQASPSRIVVLSSASALRGLANYSMYCVARGAQNAMVLALAKECVVRASCDAHARPRPGSRRLTLPSTLCSLLCCRALWM